MPKLIKVYEATSILPHREEWLLNNKLTINKEYYDFCDEVFLFVFNDSGDVTDQVYDILIKDIRNVDLKFKKSNFDFSLIWLKKSEVIRIFSAIEEIDRFILKDGRATLFVKKK